MASVFRMFAKNLLPRPSPFEAPLIKPAMSTYSIISGTIFSDFAIAASSSKRESGTLARATFGSIVQKGKFAASAFPLCVSALNKVLFPTLGNPTKPVCSPRHRVRGSGREQLPPPPPPPPRGMPTETMLSPKPPIGAAVCVCVPRSRRDDRAAFLEARAMLAMAAAPVAAAAIGACDPSGSAVAALETATASLPRKDLCRRRVACGTETKAVADSGATTPSSVA
mmetsp:Transcript_57205/g.145286  ORF Transcript_57205/g.145286 Transcript_57205/m.145286 type:complete len:225 (-) Transcript_57205:225-899(-)